jgi:tRNA nucleotidyltransferase/poly(A) polymerase
LKTLPVPYSTIRTVPSIGPEDYARFISQRLREAGYQAYLVGGCVRDLLLGRRPKDYDVATDASPEGVLELFPAAGLVGAHFGVVLVRDGDSQIEVATFRSDAGYSDGRRPDAVAFVHDPRQDAARRDFTINALFLDAATNEVLDYVGGRADLAAGLIRAIGNAEERFQEDHLRLLRAVRFAARLGFRIEEATLAAIRKLAPLVQLVAAERVREEMNQILREGAGGVELLFETGLMANVLPDVILDPERPLARLRRARPGELSPVLAWAALLFDVDRDAVALLLKRLRFSCTDADEVMSLLKNTSRLLEIDTMRIAEKKRLMRDPLFAGYLTMRRLCGEPALDLPLYTDQDLHPAKLLSGLDLLELGYPQGPLYSSILAALEDAQLEGKLRDREEAIRWVQNRF